MEDSDTLSIIAVLTFVIVVDHDRREFYGKRLAPV
jgi:hypothetical protein